MTNPLWSSEHLVSTQRRVFHRWLDRAHDIILKALREFQILLWIETTLVTEKGKTRVSDWDYLLWNDENSSKILVQLESLENPEENSVYVESNHPLFTTIQNELKGNPNIICEVIQHAWLGSLTLRIKKRQSPLQK